MEKFEEALEKLKTCVKGGQDFFEIAGIFPLDYVTATVFSALQEVFKYLIEERHKVEEAQSREENVVIHYTSIAALVSMLQVASKEPVRKNTEREREDKEPEPGTTPSYKKSLWRLYDSVHLNDPDEGNYFVRNLNLPPKYDWLGKKGVSHAYIASFVLPKKKKDMSNNLVFWQMYGQEGEGCSLSLPVPRSRLGRVRYGTASLKSTVEMLMRILDSLEPLLSIGKLSLRESVRKKLAEAVWKSLEKIRYLYKSEAYKHENECRSIVAESDIPDKDKIFFEDKNLNDSPIRIKHYYEHEDLEIKTLLATGSSITLGPRVPHADNVCYFLNTLRQRAGLAPQEIKISKIPYQKS